MRWTASIWFTPLFTNFNSTQNTARKKKKVSISKTNVFVLIKATEVIFKMQITEDNLLIKSCFHPILAPRVQNLLHC